MTTVKESITDLAALAKEIKNSTHLTENSVLKIIEMTLQKQTADRQLSIQEFQLGITPKGESSIVSIVPDEVIAEEQPPEETHD